MRLGLSPAAIRRHLDAMLDDGDVTSREQVDPKSDRGRGRPARVFPLTDAARLRAGTHTYDDLATVGAALDRRARRTGGRGGVRGRPGRRARRPLPRRRWKARVTSLSPGPRHSPIGAHRRGLRCIGFGDRHGRPAVPAPLPGGARGGRVPAAVRGRDAGDLQPRRHARPAPGHHRARRRRVHHAHPRSTAHADARRAAESRRQADAGTIHCTTVRTDQ